MKLPVVPLDEIEGRKPQPPSLDYAPMPALGGAVQCMPTPFRRLKSTAVSGGHSSPAFRWTPIRLMTAAWLTAAAYIGQARWVALLFAGASMTVTIRGCENFKPYTHTFTKDGYRLFSERTPVMTSVLLGFGIFGVLSWLVARFDGDEDTSGKAFLISFLAAVAGAVGLILTTADFDSGAGIGAVLVVLGGAPASVLGGLASFLLPGSNKWEQGGWFLGHAVLSLHLYFFSLAATLPVARWMLRTPNQWPVFWWLLVSGILIVMVGIIALTKRRGK